MRRELLDHSVVFNERHLRRLVGEYVAYYHQDRTHYALEKETPSGRLPSASQGAGAAIVARRRLGFRCDFQVYAVLEVRVWSVSPSAAGQSEGPRRCGSYSRGLEAGSPSGATPEPAASVLTSSMGSSPR